MAEVKTYKCDICGKVYHVDENVEHRVMDLAGITNGDESRDVKHYEHICEECAGKIRRVIEDPKVFEELDEKICEQLKEKYHYKSLLDRIFSVIPLKFSTRLYASSERKTDEAIEKIEDLEKSRDIWKRVASVTIGLLIGFGRGQRKFRTG